MNNASIERRRRKIEFRDRQEPARAGWRARHDFYHSEDLRALRFLVPPGASVLAVGCGDGAVLAGLEPGRGVGIDPSGQAVAAARAAHPHLEFNTVDFEAGEPLATAGETFDVILLAETVGWIDDIEQTLVKLHNLCHADTRVVIAYHAPLWEPMLRVAAGFGLKAPMRDSNWLGMPALAAVLDLAGFEVIRREWRTLVPFRLLGLGTLVNRLIAPLPGIRQLCLRNYLVARSRAVAQPRPTSASVVIPARNEKGNIEAAVVRLPQFCERVEIVFVEGHSKDGTLDEMHRVKAAYPDRDIKILVQDGKGKGDAVRKGFAAATGDVLMILDADLTVPPEDMPKFFRQIAEGRGEFINGTRLVYPMEDEAMRTLNRIANYAFSVIFTWLLNQRFTDTLCGTKVLRKRHYEAIAANRLYFGDFDPFGDFDLIFGAIKLNLKVVEVPIRYLARTYGETQISRFRHGLLLLKMVVFAWRKLKAY
ncbi:MAG: glycosyltransferase [Alphaproteobacteria bacterium]|nr:glycosyltransferase [Alphaproteobacteria bacterium]